MKAFFYAFCLQVCGEETMMSVMKYYLMIGLLLATSIQAGIYRSVDENGNVIFSDVEDERSEEIIIDLAPSPVTPSTSPNIVFDDILLEKKKQPTVTNYQLSIISPMQNENIHNPESISVEVTISPRLNVRGGDLLQFELDGKPLGNAQTLTSTQLVDIERGSHILTVSVKNSVGNVLKKSKSTLFHVHRHSVSH